MGNIAPCSSSHQRQKRYFCSFPRGTNICPEWDLMALVPRTTSGFFNARISGRVQSTPPPALNGAGRQGESRYAKSITPRPGNGTNKNSSYNKVILVMTLPIGGEVKWLVIQYGYFKLKDSLAPSIPEGLGGHRHQAVA